MAMDHWLACEGHKCVFAHFCAVFSYDVILHFIFTLLHGVTCTKQVKSCIILCVHIKSCFPFKVKMEKDAGL